MNQTAQTPMAGSDAMTDVRTLNVVVAALGGQGGGVLMDWLAALARARNWPCQSTSVPGVAQRTGATIYYLEIYPADADALPAVPVLSLFPMQQNVDLVVASEVAEAGRMVQRGFVTPDRTTVVTSSHRVYAIGERVAVGNEVVDSDALRLVTRDRAREVIMFDMMSVADANNTVISAALFGAIAGSGALPFEKREYASVIQTAGMQVDANLAAFEAAYLRAADGGAGTQPGVEWYEPDTKPEAPFELPAPTTRGGARVIERIAAFPAPVHEMLYHGCQRLAQYLDHAYAHDYLDRVAEVAAYETSGRDCELTRSFARHLALWSSFEDIARVAHLKITGARYRNLLGEVRAEPGNVVAVRDYFKPRTEEVFGALPARLGRWLSASPLAHRLVKPLTSGKRLASTDVGVFIMLRLVAGLRRFRRRMHAFQLEQERIAAWCRAVSAHGDDYDKALALSEAAALIKGYSRTRERGYGQVGRIVARAAGLTAIDIDDLVTAGLADDSSTRFDELLNAR